MKGLKIDDLREDVVGELPNLWSKVEDMCKKMMLNAIIEIVEENGGDSGPDLLLMLRERMSKEEVEKMCDKYTIVKMFA